MSCWAAATRTRLPAAFGCGRRRRSGTPRAATWRVNPHPEDDQAMTDSTATTSRPAWKALAAHHLLVREQKLRELFARDPARGQRLSAEAAGLLLDYSKNRVTDETMRLLIGLAHEA